MPNQYPFSVSELNEELEGELGPGEELEDEDFEEIKINLPKQPSFPTTIFIFALVKDFIDLASIGFLGTITNIFLWLTIKIWLFGKSSFIKRYLYKRYIFTLFLEFVPFINMIPQSTIFVLRAYAAERKKIDQILSAIENLVIRFQKGGL